MKIKRTISCIIFPLIIILLIGVFGEFLTPKSTNRYYILENDPHYSEDYDVQIYGSCHSYTSFNPVKFYENTGIRSYVYGNPGEIIPTTYVRMAEKFKENPPKVALVETWGINPYETYDATEKILGDYLTSNIERLPYSKEKNEVLRDFELDVFQMNFPLARYKDRLLDESLTEVDMYYEFENTKNYNSDYVFNEMTSRLKYYGYKSNPSRDISDYPQRQNYIEEDEYRKIEDNITKYIYKIIDLCEKYDVELIFYRSPYTSTKNELRKLNHLREICNERGITFIDLEEVIDYDYTADFYDYQHLSLKGANKSTELLELLIMNALEKNSK